MHPRIASPSSVTLELEALILTPHSDCVFGPATNHFNKKRRKTSCHSGRSRLSHLFGCWYCLVLDGITAGSRGIEAKGVCRCCSKQTAHDQNRRWHPSPVRQMNRMPNSIPSSRSTKMRLLGRAMGLSPSRGKCERHGRSWTWILQR